MPVPLIVVSFLLLFQAIFALRAGRITSAGISLGGLAYATLLLVRWYQPRSASVKDAADPAGDRALIALVYPEQAARIGELLAAVAPTCQALVVLAIELSPSTSVTVPTATLASAEKLLQGRDARLVAALERAAVGRGRAVALMRSIGPDPAFVALDLAARLGVSRLVVLDAEDASVEEQRRRCTLVWNSLPVPRQALRVHMVVPGAGPVTFDLAPSHAPSA